MGKDGIMASKVTTLYEDSAKTNALYPRTKASAVSDNDGNVLGNIAVYNAETVVGGANPIKIGVDMDLLWTNASPTSSFGAQTISLDLSNYNLVGIIYVAENGTQVNISTTNMFIYKKGITTYGVGTSVGGVWGYTRGRAIAGVSNSGVSFGDSYPMTETISTANNSMIPLYIYGIK